jgi:hypothetical protein
VGDANGCEDMRAIFRNGDEVSARGTLDSLSVLKEKVAADLKANVIKNYPQFIRTAKEISGRREGGAFYYFWFRWGGC